jgi:hypothetical protein
MAEEEDELDRVGIGIEVAKVAVLSVFLFVAFSKAGFPDVLWKPGEILLKGGLVALAFFAGRHFADVYKQGWRNYLLIFYGVGILTIVAWAGLGTRTENADPVYGGGDTVVDFVPSNTERSNHAVTVFLSLGIPALYGMYKRRNPY